MDGGEEAGAQVVVQVLVLAHLEHFLPLLLRHLALDALGGLLLLPQLLTAKLQPQDTHLIITQYTLWCTTHSNRPLEGKAGAMLTNVLCH